MDFAIIRCGYGMNQPDQDDARWLETVTGCEAAGIPMACTYTPMRIP